MRRKNWIVIMVLGIVSLMLSGCSLLEGLLFTKPNVEEFSFSGYVSADGEALAGAKVDCGVATCETDEDGKYKFEKITKVVQVKVSKEGYLFKDELVFVSSTSNGVDFKGYQLFDKSGVVKNGDTVIPNVEILATSETGDYTTKTNEYGEFYLPNLAGQVKVKATLSPFKFFTQSFTIAKEDKVTISGTTDILGMIKTNSLSASKDDFTLIVGGKEVAIQDNLTFLATDVEPGTEITLKSDKYYIQNDTIKLGYTIENILFNCEKIYSVTGKIKCGEMLINNATIEVGKRLILSPDGNFTINNLHGKNYINCSLTGYTFDTVVVENEADINVQGKFSVMGNVTLDYGVDYSDITLCVGTNQFKVDMLGKFTIDHVAYGDEIKVASNDYVLMDKIIITSFAPITISLQKYFDCDIIVMQDNLPLENAKVSIENNDYYTDANGKIELQNLYGNVELIASKDGYKFESNYTINNAVAERVNNQFTIVANKLYDITGKVMSKDIPLSAFVSTDIASVTTNELGEFTIHDAYSRLSIMVTADNYNPKTISVTIDNSKDIIIDLSYNVTGIIKNADNVVDNALVLINGESSSIYTDELGKFTLLNLSGETTLTFKKDFYTFESETINKSTDLEILSTFAISGNVTQKEGDSVNSIANFKVTLFNRNTHDMLETTTDDLGRFSFENLSGEFVLAYDYSSAISLKPKVYEVSNGGNTYDFSNSGYSFGGKITCGEELLDGVTVKIGDKTTKTKDGIYNFELVSNPGTISLYKEGYTFENNGMAIDDSFDERQDVNFTATYKVTGTIKSGKTPVGNVNIEVLDSANNIISSTTSKTDGTFEVSGLTGTNKLVLQYLDYTFEGESEINGYAKLNFVGTLNVTANYLSGDILLDNAIVYVNGIERGVTNNNGVITLDKLQLGDLITAKKDGYEIAEIILDYTTNLNVNASYTIAGKVTNSGSNLENVKITLSNVDSVYYTDKYGRFEISGIVGSHNVTFELTGFEFDPITILGANLDYLVMSKYSIEGTIKVGGMALSGMIVKAGNITATTNSSGYFVLNGLTSIETLEFEKAGYSVDGIIQVSKHEVLDIQASYTLSGTIRSGELDIDGAYVSVTDGTNNWDATTTNGTFEISGLKGIVTVTVQKDGYNLYQKEIKSFTPNAPSLLVDLLYNVVVNFDDNYMGVKVSVKGVGDNNYNDTKTFNSKSITLENLSGTNDITFQKDNCSFSPNQFRTKLETTKDVSIKLIYSISGKVKTSNGVAISNAIVKMEADGVEKTVYTDTNGAYKFDGVSGYPWITATLPNITITDASTQNLTKQVTKANISGTSLDFAFDANDFGLHILNFGYDTLRNANNYQIIGGGKVVPNTSLSGTQNVKVTYKKDSLGHKIFENRNYGDVKLVDTNVSLLSYFDMNSDTVKYNQVFEKSKVATNGSSVSYDQSWTTTSRADYLKNFGVNWNGFSPYVIEKATIKSVNNIARSTIDGEDCYSFKIVLNHENSATYSYYKQLMSKMCSMQTLNYFSKIELDIVITTGGFLRKMDINESYSVEAKGVSVSTDANITYNFYINSTTEEVIENIDVSSPQTVYEAVVRGRENKTTLNSFKPHSLSLKVDYVASKKEYTYEEI